MTRRNLDPRIPGRLQPRRRHCPRCGVSIVVVRLATAPSVHIPLEVSEQYRGFRLELDGERVVARPVIAYRDHRPSCGRR